MKRPLIAGATTLLFVSLSTAQTSVNLDFNGVAGNTLADTGFDGALNPGTNNFNVNGAGRLIMTTQSGDTFGDYENDPDTAKNLLFSNLDTTGGTTVDAFLSVRGLNENFHGGGIWMGLDTDHYIRLGVINNGSEMRVEALRENEDLWGVRGGPGGDIMGDQSAPGAIGASGIGTSVDISLRLVRNGSSATAFYSLDGINYTQVGGTFAGFQVFGTAFTESSQLKVGAYAFGGPDTQTAATLSFDSFTAQAVPEPASMVALAFGAAAMLRRRKRA